MEPRTALVYTLVSMVPDQPGVESGLVSTVSPCKHHFVKYEIRQYEICLASTTNTNVPISCVISAPF